MAASVQSAIGPVGAIGLSAAGQRQAQEPFSEGDQRRQVLVPVLISEVIASVAADGLEQFDQVPAINLVLYKDSRHEPDANPGDNGLDQM